MRKSKSVKKKETGIDIEYNPVFKASPAPYLLLLPDKGFTIVAVSDSYNRATNTKREDIVGRALFEVFPDNPDDPTADGVRMLTASLQRVLKTKKPDSMALQKYDIPRPASMGGGFEVRYWDPLNTPVLDKAKKVQYIIHNVNDVTEMVRLKEKQAAQLEWAKKLEAAEKKYMQSIKENETMFRHLTQNLAHHAIFMLDHDGYIVSWNEGAQKINGYKAEEIIGKHNSVFYTLEEIENNIPAEHLKTAIKNGHFDAKLWRVHKDNSRFHARVVITPIYNDGGRLTGFTSITNALNIVPARKVAQQ